MASNTKKSYILFLILAATINLNAQSSVKEVTTINSSCQITLLTDNQNNLISDESISKKSHNSIEAIELFNPKDSFITAVEKNLKEEDKTKNIANFSGIAKDILEKFKYDFSETFIDILFYENIDLARIRTI